MYKYILVCTYTCLDVQTKNSMYWYVLVCTDHVTGFRGKHICLPFWLNSCAQSNEFIVVTFCYVLFFIPAISYVVLLPHADPSTVHVCINLSFLCLP